MNDHFIKIVMQCICSGGDHILLLIDVIQVYAFNLFLGLMTIVISAYFMCFVEGFGLDLVQNKSIKLYRRVIPDLPQVQRTFVTN